MRKFKDMPAKAASPKNKAASPKNKAASPKKKAVGSWKKQADAEKKPEVRTGDLLKHCLSDSGLQRLLRRCGVAESTVATRDHLRGYGFVFLVKLLTKAMPYARSAKRVTLFPQDFEAAALELGFSVTIPREPQRKRKPKALAPDKQAPKPPNPKKQKTGPSPPPPRDPVPKAVDMDVEELQDEEDDETLFDS